MTTTASFYAALAALSITGVKRSFGYEPDSVTTADLPAFYVRLPQSDAGRNSGWAASCSDASKERRAEVVILIEAAGQDRTAANFANTLTYFGRLETALDAADIGVYSDYVIRAGVVQKNETPYWAVIAEYSTRG